VITYIHGKAEPGGEDLFAQDAKAARLKKVFIGRRLAHIPTPVHAAQKIVERMSRKIGCIESNDSAKSVRRLLKSPHNRPEGIVRNVMDESDHQHDSRVQFSTFFVPGVSFDKSDIGCRESPGPGQGRSIRIHAQVFAATEEWNQLARAAAEIQNSVRFIDPGKPRDFFVADEPDHQGPKRIVDPRKSQETGFEVAQQRTRASHQGHFTTN